MTDFLAFSAGFLTHEVVATREQLSLLQIRLRSSK